MKIISPPLFIFFLPFNLKMPAIHFYNPTQNLFVTSHFNGTWTLSLSNNSNASGIKIERYDLDVLIDSISNPKQQQAHEETVELCGRRYLSVSRNSDKMYLQMRSLTETSYTTRTLTLKTSDVDPLLCSLKHYRRSVSQIEAGIRQFTPSSFKLSDHTSKHRGCADALEDYSTEKDESMAQRLLGPDDFYNTGEVMFIFIQFVVVFLGSNRLALLFQ